MTFIVVFFFFKQKTAYEMRISDWSSDVCSSDLVEGDSVLLERHHRRRHRNPALLLDLHPVGTRAPVRAARLDLAGKMDRAARDEQLLGQRGLARIGVGTDREGAARRRGHWHPENVMPALFRQIGRAWCRERVCQYVCLTVFCGSLKKKIHTI